jgi:hypothetical protein
VSTVIAVTENPTTVTSTETTTTIATATVTTVVSQQVTGLQGPIGPAGVIANSSLALEPELLIVGNIYRNSSNVVTSASVQWPDGTTGTYTSLSFDSATGAVNSYKITKGIATYTQPILTRNSDGAVTNRPGIVIT